MKKKLIAVIPTAVKNRFNDLVFRIEWKLRKDIRKEWENAVAYAMEAYKRCRTAGTLFYVLPDENRVLRVYNAFYIRELIRKNQMSNKAKPKVVKSECFFYTPENSSGYRRISPEEVKLKQKMWLAYAKKWNLHKKSKNGKTK
ncbi:MAG: hypothetical protein JZU53_06995 [Paludibacter sp.]|nr:hypothetical protein [Paludibacter sp.]